MSRWRSSAADALLWLDLALGIVFVLSLEGCASDIAFNGVRGPNPAPRKLAPVAKTRIPLPDPAPISVDGTPPTKANTWIPRIGGYGDLPCVGGSCPVER